MKLKMKSAIKLYESFLKEGAEAHVASETTSTTSREAVIKDVDTIITSLETLVSQVSEELEEELNAVENIEEADDNVIVQWITSMKAVKAQKKVNNIKVNKVALEIARDEAPNTEQKNKIKDKETLLTNQIKSLQDAVNDRFANKGGLVDKKLSNAKIEGELAVIKAHSGAGIDKKEAGDLKQRMADLQKRYKENEVALKELEPSEEDKKAAAEEAKKKKEADIAAAEQAKKDQESAEAEKAKKDQEAADAEQAKKDQEATPATDPAAEAIKAKIAEYEQAMKDLSDKNDKASKDKIAMLAAAVASEREKLDKLSPKESLLARAYNANLNELVSYIYEKEDWQLDGTSLYTKLDVEIKKVEMTNTLNEGVNPILNLSVKDKFSNLL